MVGLIGSLLASTLINVGAIHSPCLKTTDIYRLMVNSIVVVNNETKKSMGTGVEINERGDVITSTHVITDEKLSKDHQITIYDHHKNKYNYRQILGDPESISMLKPMNESNHPKQFRSINIAVNPKIGEKAYVVGHSLGYRYSFISGFVGNLWDDGKIIQLDMSVNMGMSGSPVVNCHGDIIGFVLSTTELGIGFANAVTDVAPLFGMN